MHSIKCPKLFWDISSSDRLVSCDQISNWPVVSQYNVVIRAKTFVVVCLWISTTDCILHNIRILIVGFRDTYYTSVQNGYPYDTSETNLLPFSKISWWIVCVACSSITTSNHTATLCDIPLWTSILLQKHLKQTVRSLQIISTTYLLLYFQWFLHYAMMPYLWHAKLTSVKTYIHDWAYQLGAVHGKINTNQWFF